MATLRHPSALAVSEILTGSLELVRLSASARIVEVVFVQVVVVVLVVVVMAARELHSEEERRRSQVVVVQMVVLVPLVALVGENWVVRSACCSADRRRDVSKTSSSKVMVPMVWETRLETSATVGL